LLIGRTGQGKSALANVLGGDNKKVKTLKERELEKSEDKELKESGNSTSETKGIQIVEFEHKGETYQIIDTVGIGDTKLTEAQVLLEIAKGYDIIKNGIHQVLFVNGERFTSEEVGAYDMLKKFFFDGNDIDKYTTIVRTRFDDFEDENSCDRDILLLREENNPEITNMINSCNGIIHIDNPSINIKGKRGEEKNSHNKKIREASREKLLEHLAI